MEGDALTTAVTWIAGVLTGTVATVVAVLAVAAVGMMALTGRMATRRAAEVVLRKPRYRLQKGRIAPSIQAAIVRGFDERDSNAGVLWQG